MPRFFNFLCFKSCSGSVLFACNFLCSTPCFRLFFCATFCTPNHVPDGFLRVPLFVLQIVSRMDLFTRNFLCFKSCSGWAFSRATFCASNCSPDGFFACNFLCSKSCSRCFFSRAIFSAPNRAPDGSFCVHFFGPGALKIIKNIFGFILHVAPALPLLAKVNISFCRPRHLATG